MSTSNGRPPLSRSSSATSPKQSRTSVKSQKSSASDSPSNSATNNHGRSVVDARLRSVLSHPLGLPLVYMLNGKNPINLPFLARESKFHSNVENAKPSTEFDNIFSDAVNDWWNLDTLVDKADEKKLTKLLSDEIENQNSKTGFYSAAEVAIRTAADTSRVEGFTDILLTPNPNGKDSTDKESSSRSTPLAVIEVGRNDLDWWKKLDQNIKYVDRLGKQQQDKRLCFEKPLLSVVLTIEGEKEKLKVKLGAFLCCPKDNSGDHNNFRMTLLWQFSTSDLKEASKAFGKLLRTTSDFSRWRDASVDAHQRFEYFSSNCSRFDNFVSGVRIPMTPYPRLCDT